MKAKLLKRKQITVDNSGVAEVYRSGASVQHARVLIHRHNMHDDLVKALEVAYGAVAAFSIDDPDSLFISDHDFIEQTLHEAKKKIYQGETETTGDQQHERRVEDEG